MTLALAAPPTVKASEQMPVADAEDAAFTNSRLPLPSRAVAVREKLNCAAAVVDTVRAPVGTELVSEVLISFQFRTFFSKKPFFRKLFDESTPSIAEVLVVLVEAPKAM